MKMYDYMDKLIDVENNDNIDYAHALKELEDATVLHNAEIKLVEENIKKLTQEAQSEVNMKQQRIRDKVTKLWETMLEQNPDLIKDAAYVYTRYLSITENSDYSDMDKETLTELNKLWKKYNIKDDSNVGIGTNSSIDNETPIGDTIITNPSASAMEIINRHTGFTRNYQKNGRGTWVET